MKINYVAAVLALAGFPASAIAAGFVDESSNNPFSIDQQVRLIGTDNFEPVYGFARDIALRDAIKAVVPDRYNVSSAGIGAYSQTKVSWAGGQPWNKVLEAVVAQVPQLHVSIDTRAKSVDITTASTGGGSSATVLAEVQSIQPNQQISTESAQTNLAPPVVRNWPVNAGTSLRATLDNWARTEGWQEVAWELKDDFVLGATARFQGSLAEAIESLVSSIHGAGDVRVELYQGNRVIRVTNKARGIN